MLDTLCIGVETMGNSFPFIFTHQYLPFQSLDLAGKKTFCFNIVTSQVHLLFTIQSVISIEMFKISK